MDSRFSFGVTVESRSEMHRTGAVTGDGELIFHLQARDAALRWTALLPAVLVLDAICR